MTLADAAQHWESLGIAEEQLHRDTKGRHGTLAYAEMCHRTAKALRLEIETGKAHCSCCLSPDNWHQ
jgi:hypothetical protein